MLLSQATDGSPRPGHTREGGGVKPGKFKALPCHVAGCPSYPDKRPNLIQPPSLLWQLGHNAAGLWPGSADQVSSNIPASLPSPADKGLFVANVYFLNP